MGGAQSTARATLLLVAILAIGRAAWATGPVEVEVRGCASVDPEEVERIVQAEVGAGRRPSEHGRTTRLDVRCLGPTVALTVHDPITRKRLERAVSVETTDSRAQARLVAIAAAELLLASWAELESNPMPQVSPLGEAPDPTDTAFALDALEQRRERSRAANAEEAAPPGLTHGSRPPRRGDGESRVMAVATTRFLLRYPGSLSGGGLRLGNERHEIVSWSLDALFESGQIVTPSDRYQLDAATVGASVAFFTRIVGVSLRAGAGLRWGFTASGSGGSDSAQAVSVVPWGWPMLASSAVIPFTERLRGEIGAEAGYVVMPAAGASGTSNTRDLRGLWVGLGCALGLAF